MIKVLCNSRLKNENQTATVVKSYEICRVLQPSN